MVKDEDGEVGQKRDYVRPDKQKGHIQHLTIERRALWMNHLSAIVKIS